MHQAAYRFCPTPQRKPDCRPSPLSADKKTTFIVASHLHAPSILYLAANACQLNFIFFSSPSSSLYSIVHLHLHRSRSTSVATSRENFVRRSSSIYLLPDSCSKVLNQYLSPSMVKQTCKLDVSLFNTFYHLTGYHLSPMSLITRHTISMSGAKGCNLDLDDSGGSADFPRHISFF